MYGIKVRDPDQCDVKTWPAVFYNPNLSYHLSSHILSPYPSPLPPPHPPLPSPQRIHPPLQHLSHNLPKHPFRPITRYILRYYIPIYLP